MSIRSWAASPAALSGAVTVLNGYGMTLNFLHDWRLMLVDWLTDEYGILGFTEFDTGRVVIRSDLPYAQMRSTAAHETVHAIRGASDESRRSRDEEEIVVESIAAAFLVPEIRLAKKMADEGSPKSAATWWACDEATIACRISRMSVVPSSVRTA